VRPVCGSCAIDANVVVRATGVPVRPSESSHATTGLANGPVRVESAMSPPTSACEFSRTEAATFPANESMATSAATPSAMDDM
jgi:hypothetical protein